MPAMIDRIPSGTRDVLPDEMRELRAMTERIRAVFERAGYGEVYTPALEYESTFARTDMDDSRPAYRVFDEQGNVLVLRSDMTMPIARLVATRYVGAEPPLRFCYFAHAYRGVRPQRGQSREFLQAGVELIGSPGPEGTAEVLTVLCDALDAAGLETYRVGLGDASLYPSLLEALGVDPARTNVIVAELARATSSASSARSASSASAPQEVELLLRVPRTRGGPEVLDGLDGALKRRPDRDARAARAARAGRGAADHLRPRARAEPRLLHRGRVPGLRPGLRGPDRQRRPLRRAAGELWRVRCPRSASRSTSSGCTSR